VDLQGFIVGKKFIVKKVAVLRKEAILSLYIFTYPCYEISSQNPKNIVLPG